MVAAKFNLFFLNKQRSLFEIMYVHVNRALLLIAAYLVFGSSWVSLIATHVCIRFPLSMGQPIEGPKTLSVCDSACNMACVIIFVWYLAVLGTYQMESFEMIEFMNRNLVCLACVASVGTECKSLGLLSLNLGSSCVILEFTLHVDFILDWLFSGCDERLVYGQSLADEVGSRQHSSVCDINNKGFFSVVGPSGLAAAGSGSALSSMRSSLEIGFEKLDEIKSDIFSSETRMLVSGPWDPLHWLGDEIIVGNDTVETLSQLDVDEYYECEPDTFGECVSGDDGTWASLIGRGRARRCRRQRWKAPWCPGRQIPDYLVLEYLPELMRQFRIEKGMASGVCRQLHDVPGRGDCINGNEGVIAAAGR